MAEEPPPLDSRLRTLERTLADLEERLNAIEHRAPQPAGSTRSSDGIGIALPSVDVAGTFAHTGRAVVLCAGAFLLRALTEAGLVPQLAGAVLGLAYALALAIVADRVAARHSASASFLGACTVVISFPLLWEITSRFVLITPVISAVALTGTVAIVLGVAWHRCLQALAWIATIGACVLGFGLLLSTGAYLPFTMFLIALGIATLWLGYDREWIGLRWVAAFFADLSVLMLIARTMATPPLESPAAVMGTLLFLLMGYLGSIAIRTLVRKRDLLPFEAAQAAALLVAGVGGAVVIAHRTGTGAPVLGPALACLSAGSYLVALIHRESNARAANYYFYTTLALVFALTGGKFIIRNTAAGVLWTVLAFGMSWLARRYGRSTLHVHAAAYLLVGAWTTGLAGTSFIALFGSAAAAVQLPPPSAWLVAIAIAVCWWVAVMPASQPITKVSRFLLMLLLILTAAGVGVGALCALLLPGVDATLQPAVVATTRTAAFATGAVLVAWLGTRSSVPEAGWLVYPLLGWGLLKLLFEDLRVSPPSLLVVALGLYGAALIVAPRLTKRTGSTV